MSDCNLHRTCINPYYISLYAIKTGCQISVNVWFYLEQWHAILVRNVSQSHWRCSCFCFYVWLVKIIQTFWLHFDFSAHLFFQVHLLWWTSIRHRFTTLWAHPCWHYQGHCHPLCPSEWLPCGPTIWVGLPWLACGKTSALGKRPVKAIPHVIHNLFFAGVWDW